jgi:hypothetical protein
MQFLRCQKSNWMVLFAYETFAALANFARRPLAAQTEGGKGATPKIRSPLKRPSCVRVPRQLATQMESISVYFCKSFRRYNISVNIKKINLKMKKIAWSIAPPNFPHNFSSVFSIFPILKYILSIFSHFPKFSICSFLFPTIFVIFSSFSP